MLSRIFLLFLAFASLGSPLQGGVWDNVTGYFKRPVAPEPPTIRVLVIHNVDGVNLEVHGRYSLFDPHTNSYLSTRFKGKSRYIQTMSDGLKWGEAFPGLYQLKIRPDENTSFSSIDGYDYDGVLSIYDIGGKISIVNQITIESYLRSILSSLQEEDLEPETLAAIVIAARTNAYFQAMTPKNAYWAVDGQKVGFQGRAALNSSLEGAIRQTRYMIMSRTGVYERVATPFAAQFGNMTTGQSTKDVVVSKISIEEANAIARNGGHAAQILGKAFPETTIMLMQYSQ